MISITSTINWLGDRVLAAALGDLDRRMVDAGNRWLAMSRSLAPFRTGRLRAEEDFQVADHTLILIMGAPYDIFQEFGTRHIRPHPHVRPALNAIGHTLGFDLQMEFNRPEATGQWIRAQGAGFVLPSTLTRRQRQHVQRHLVPVSRWHHHGNVRKARMRVRRFD